MYIHFEYGDAYDIVETLKKVARFLDESPEKDTLQTLIITFKLGMLKYESVKWVNLPEYLTPDQMDDLFDINVIEYTRKNKGGSK